MILFAGFEIGLHALTRLKDGKPSWTAAVTQWMFDRRGLGIIRVMLTLLVCWTPYVVLMWPGNLYMDTSWEVAWFAELCDTGDWPSLSSQHPLCDTLLFGWIIWGLYCLTGHFKIGIFVLLLLQVIFTAFSFSFALRKARMSWGCPSGLIVAAMAFFALCPLIPCSVCSLSKDSLFSFIYVLFIVVFVDKLRGAKENKLLLILALLMCLTKKYGAYVAILSLVTLAVALKNNSRDRFCLVLSSVICASIVWAAVPCFENSVKIRPGGAQEMLSVPLQQTALTLIRHQDEMSEDDLAVIGRVINVESVSEDYMPISADGVKGYHPRTDNAGYLDYLRVWLKQGLRYPATYLDAWAALEAPLFSAVPLKLIFDSHHTAAGTTLPEGYWEKWDWNQRGSLFVSGMYDWFTTLPIVNIMTFAFLYVLLIPAFICIVLAQCGKTRRCVILVPILVSLGGILLAPVSAASIEATRYILPFIYTAPIILFFAWNMLHPEAALHG